MGNRGRSVVYTITHVRISPAIQNDTQRVAYYKRALTREITAGHRIH
jgi:hypothetical protein